MLSIGEFALHGQVSVRMLRHYDNLGLLVPAHVDPWTGYRSYTADQLPRLNRIVALNDLGIPLRELAPVLDRALTPEELRAMLSTRRQELAAQIADDERRLRAVERRLRTIEKEDHMDLQFTEKALPEQRVSQRRAHAGSHAEIGGVVAPMFEELLDSAVRAGLDPHSPSVAVYSDVPEGGVAISVGFPIGQGDSPLPGYDDATLAAVPRAVCTLHVGDMETISDSWQALMQYVGAQGLSPAGPFREVYLATPEGREDDWRTELQQPVC